MVYKICPVCRGSKKERVPICDGFKLLDCSNCEGEGMVERKSEDNISKVDELDIGI